LLLLLLNANVFEVAPLRQDFHGLDVLDCRQLVTVVLVPAQGVQVHFFAQAFVLSFYDFQNVEDLLAIVNFFVVDTNYRVEDCPHHFGVVDPAKMVFYVQAENNLVEL
jgi:hypothetical protein